MFNFIGTGILIAITIALVVVALYFVLKWPIKLLKMLIKSPFKACKWWIITTKRSNWLKDLQEYYMDFQDGYLTQDEIDEILNEYNRRNPSIWFQLTNSGVVAPDQDIW